MDALGVLGGGAGRARLTPKPRSGFGSIVPLPVPTSSARHVKLLQRLPAFGWSALSLSWMRRPSVFLFAIRLCFSSSIFAVSTSARRFGLPQPSRHVVVDIVQQIQLVANSSNAWFCDDAERRGLPLRYIPRAHSVQLVPTGDSASLPMRALMPPATAWNGRLCSSSALY